jgi:RNA polymerase-interacting CarD/CdnL/TRCF family regulator
MSESITDFQIGDQVIHWAHGPGVVIRLDDKLLAGRPKRYYVVQIRDLTVWAPIDESEKHYLRYPTTAGEFEKLFQLLASPGEPLADDRLERKNQLNQRMQDGRLESVCLVIRDLCAHKRLKKMNDYDNALMERARSFLLNEWCIALSVPLHQAEHELKNLLQEDAIPIKR